MTTPQLLDGPNEGLALRCQHVQGEESLRLKVNFQVVRLRVWGIGFRV